MGEAKRRIETGAGKVSDVDDEAVKGSDTACGTNDFSDERRSPLGRPIAVGRCLCVGR
ncbi:hypothetical protein OZX57_03240 [Bifidobacterium sp. ESL0682]|uniref:hypothetical protein n=1 Tax=Bifidobacterium sp. ESL0682 TaxID=2983212 RepID=UPI0023FA3687|nr:hypothetical protein [Bifidobacterium sp. ESL0682]WEV42472.1 hypothetical protein OZX57_03240 [Bifidobacterium sp. ESL0682]